MKIFYLILILALLLVGCASNTQPDCPQIDERAKLWNNFILNDRADEIGNRNCTIGDYNEYWKICAEHTCPNNITLQKINGEWLCVLNSTTMEG